MPLLASQENLVLPLLFLLLSPSKKINTPQSAIVCSLSIPNQVKYLRGRDFSLLDMLFSAECDFTQVLFYLKSQDFLPAVVFTKYLNSKRRRAT